MPSSLTPTGAERVRLKSMLDQVDADLLKDVLPFWSRNTLDEPAGGFITHLDRFGNRTGATDKYLVMQARMVWMFSRAHRAGIAGPFLELAAKGVEFLTRKMWDPTHGGFYFAVDRNGQPTDMGKFAYGQSFAIYALAEHRLAGGDAAALTWAEHAFDTLQQRALDGESGYREDFTRDWTPIASNLGDGTKDSKSLNTHMHLMEAFTTLCEASRKPAHEQALRKLTHLLLAHSIDHGHGGAYEAYDLQWRPKPNHEPELTTSYGHNLEYAWLLLDTLDLLKIPRDRHKAAILGMVDHAIRFGFDSERGGIAMYGPLTGRTEEAATFHASRMVKDWWEQAEALCAFAEMLRWTADRRYLGPLEKQWEWIWKHQIDHEGGDWYSAVEWSTGRPLDTNKGSAWKACYHNGRALLRTSLALKALLGLPGTFAPA